MDKRHAFTLVEVLVSMVILAMMMLIITSVIGQAQRSWRAASSRITQFREARQAFDTVTRSLRQATINSRRDYFYANGAVVPQDPKEPPAGLKVTAELGIKIGRATTLFQGAGGPDIVPGHGIVFQAPLGKTGDVSYAALNNLLCSRGYFVMFGSDSEYVPRKLATRLESKYRYRLMEYQPNSEDNEVYGATNGAWTSVSYATSQADMHPVAENIVVMALGASFTPAAGANQPDLAFNGAKSIKYSYDSYQETGGPGTAYRLPHTVQVVMVAMDEESASRIAGEMGTSAPNFVGASGASFTDPDKLKDDLERLTTYMQSKKVNYRVFSSSVLIMAAGA